MKIARLLLTALAALVLCTGAQAAAQTAAIAPVSIGAELQEDLAETYGEREGAYLKSQLERALTSALRARGVSIDAAAALRIDAEIIEAKPNRPTFAESSRNVSLSYTHSVGVGGADLRAVVHMPDGGAREVAYKYFTPGLDDIIGEPSTWSDAERAMRRFASRVAEIAAP